jgi:hypothetical protein
MVAVDPIHRDASVEQRRRHCIQWLFALDIAEQYGGLGRGWQSGQTSLDVVPILVDIANENETHAGPIRLGRSH